jgi:clan AA aspartic protease (TIGR02281 family)
MALLPGGIAAAALVTRIVGSGYAEEGIPSVDFKLRGNLIVVDAMVNGIAMPFILDTGASATVLSRESATTLGISEVRRMVGVGAGGEVEAALTRVDSIKVGEATERDLTCMIMDLSEIGRRIGGNISGVLGFDFLSHYRIMIDYPSRRLSLERAAAPSGAEAAPRIEGDLFASARDGLRLRRPDGSWQFLTETPLPNDVVVIEKPNTRAQITVGVQKLHGMTLEQLLPAVEESLPLEVEDYSKTASRPLQLGETEAMLIDYTGRQDGVETRFWLCVAKVEERLITLSLQADAADFDSYATDFEQVIRSVELVR